MTDFSDKALLPAGMGDVLPPEAEIESRAMEDLISQFSGRGYQRVKPPLIEFEESLLSDNGAAMTHQTFRMMDPVSQQMMGVRADMTLQVARIATTRLKKAHRPLRLCYGDQVLRVRGTQLRPDRQFGQVGMELIGVTDPTGDAEVILAAVEALSGLDIPSLSVDLAMPSLSRAVASALDLSEQANAELRQALDRKDIAAVSALSDVLGVDGTNLFKSLLEATGPADKSMAALMALDLPAQAAAERSNLADVLSAVRAGDPDMTLTIDPVEIRGFEYHSGVTFTFFSKGIRGELGSGGRYIAGRYADDDGEPATGMTLYMDTVLRAMPKQETGTSVYLPPGTSLDEGHRLRAEGYITVAGFDGAPDTDAEATRMGCALIYRDGKVIDSGSARN